MKVRCPKCGTEMERSGGCVDHHTSFWKCPNCGFEECEWVLEQTVVEGFKVFEW